MSFHVAQEYGFSSMNRAYVFLVVWACPAVQHSKFKEEFTCGFAKCRPEGGPWPGASKPRTILCQTPSRFCAPDYRQRSSGRIPAHTYHHRATVDRIPHSRPTKEIKMVRTTKVALLQLEPVFKQPEQSILRANSLVSSIKPNDIDLLMLPEMAFTGYNFRSFEDIEPYIESEVDGISITWAKETAELSCDNRVRATNPRAGRKTTLQCHGDRFKRGRIDKVYHKTQLYPPVDPLWARAGEGFSMMDLNIARVDGQRGQPVNCCIGICMDLSPDKFEAPFDAYELSTFAAKNKAELLLCCMAWLDLGPQPNPKRTEIGKSAAETSEQLKHWEVRCTPFWNLENRACAICNRVGIESAEAIFCGTSCVISNAKVLKTLMKDNMPIVMDYASKHHPELLIVDIPLP
ncbi:hypothetical protein H4Q26_010082 [Puccinia striiformis f. sp. tritici PST-130]|nr:hypothetical protein H4Q26_010082 [Puccinia striiformis f. sp. tritici PST-130]